MKTRKVSISEFLKIYKANLDAFFKAQDNGEDNEDFGIYGQDFTITWNGLTVNIGDGATPANLLIPALEEIAEEIGE